MAGFRLIIKFDSVVIRIMKKTIAKPGLITKIFEKSRVYGHVGIVVESVGSPAVVLFVREGVATAGDAVRAELKRAVAGRRDFASGGFFKTIKPIAHAAEWGSAFFSF